MKNFKFILLTFSLLLTTFSSNAWHLTGGEMSYECLGNNQYEITIRVYRDANTQQGVFFDNPMLLSVFDGNGQVPNGFSNPITVPYINISSAINNNFCGTVTLATEVATYVTTLSLPLNSTGYHITHQRCCLNPNISNIFNPNNYGMTLTTFISTDALILCNSSPKFNTNITSTFCVGNPITMDYSASDLDGDILVYSFSTPHDGLDQSNPAGVPVAPPYGFVPFIPPFSENTPFGTSVTIDSTTGMISGVLNSAGSYYFGVKVADYQNGILLSETKRIFLINSVACNVTTEINNINVCDNGTFSFGNNIYDSTGIYEISTFNSEGCESLIILNIDIANEIIITDSTIINDSGNSSGAVSFQLLDSTANYTYLWNNGDTTDNINNVNAGIYTVTVTSDNGCSEVFEFEITLDVNTNFIRNENFDITLFPNPISTTDFINIHIKAIQKSDLSISVININGQVLETISHTVQKGENQLKTNLNLPKGIYYLLIKDEQQQVIERLPIVIE